MRDRSYAHRHSRTQHAGDFFLISLPGNPPPCSPYFMLLPPHSQMMMMMMMGLEQH